MGQDIFDLVVVLTLVFFTFRGFSNGLIVEIAGICALVCGFLAARAWHANLAPYLEFIKDPSWQVIVSCVIIFMGVMLAIGFLARILQKMVNYSFVGWLNRLAGALLGLAKGILLWAFIFIILDSLFHNADFMQNSRVLPYFKIILQQLQQWLPPSMASRINIE